MEVIISHLTKIIKERKILDDINLTISSGSSVALVGANGAGKTSLIRCLLGLYSKYDGNIIIDECDIRSKNFSEQKQKIAFMLDTTGLFATLSAWENIEFYDRLHKNDSSSRRKRISNVLNSINLLNRSKEMLHGYSKGMKQRLSIGRTMILNPKLIILDEPFQGLDVEGRIFLCDYLTRLKKGGCTIIISSHDLYMIEKFCEQIIFVKEGKIVAQKYINITNEDVNGVYFLRTSNNKKIYENLSNQYFIDSLENVNDGIMISLKTDISVLSKWLIQYEVTILELRTVNNDLEAMYKKYLG